MRVHPPVSSLDSAADPLSGLRLPSPSSIPGFDLPHVDITTSALPLRCFVFPEGNEDPARTVLCIPGMAASGLSFARLRPLARDFRFLLLSGPVDPYPGGSRSAFAAAVCEVVDQNERPIILGTSFGSMVAIDAASHRCPSLSGLVLTAAFARNHAFPPPLRIMEKILPRLQWLAKVMAPLSARFVGGSGLDPRASAEVAREAAETSAGERKRRLVEVFDSDLRGMLPQITVPSIVIHGTKDSLVAKRDALELAALIPHCEYREISGAGHLPYLSHWETFNSMLEPFLRKAFSGGEDSPKS